MQYLVNSPDAINFLDSAQLDSGLSAMLGDPKALDASVAPDIQSAHIVLKGTSRNLPPPCSP